MKLQILDINSADFDKDRFNETAHYHGEPYWLNFVRPHINEIGVGIRLVPFDMIDTSSPWFISLAPKSWTWDDNLPNLLSGFSPQIQHELLHGNAYLIINHECESFTKSFIPKIYDSLRDTGLDYRKIIYMVAAPDVERELDRYMSSNQLFSHQRIQTMVSTHVYKRLMSSQMPSFEYPLTYNKEKKFLALHRVARDHRIMMVSLLAYYGLLDSGYVSLGLQPGDIEGSIRELELMRPAVPQEVFRGFELIRDRLPLQVDDVDLTVNQFNTNSLPTSFYQNSYFSVVSSTFALSNKEPSVGFTEKEVKPILYKPPFSIHNLPGVLKHMRSMGFMTFGKWFDESYDDEVDDYQRLNKIVAEVARLSQIPNHQWDTMLREMQPILLHNYNRLVKYNSEHSFFNSDLKNFLYYVN